MVLAVIAAALAVAGLAGALRGESDEATAAPEAAASRTATVTAAPEVTASAAAPTTSPPEETTAPPPSNPHEPPSPADRSQVPASVEEWAAVVTALYERRSSAFAAGSADRLADVYTPASTLLAADSRHVADLTAAGEVLRGFTPSVAGVQTATVSADRADLVLVDGWAGYEVVAAVDPGGPVLRTAPGRAESTVRMVLVRTGEGWRIDTAARTG
jgi:hypothetical protein